MDSLPQLEQWHRKISREVLRGRQHHQSAIDALRLSSHLIGLIQRLRNRGEEQAMTPLTDVQLDRIRQTIQPTVDDWRADNGIPHGKEHGQLVNRIVAAIEAMRQSGVLAVTPHRKSET